MSQDVSSPGLGFRTSLASLTRVLFPHQCPVCFKQLLEQGICGTCWGNFTFITDPCCLTCGYPFSFKNGESTLQCGNCLKQAPAFKQARSVLAYTPSSKKLVFFFKHGRKLMLSPLFSRWLFHKDPKLFEGIDLVVPVPLHWRRLWYRRFNQSAVLAQLISQHTTLPYEAAALKRVRATPRQGKLSAAQRLDNVKKAFTVPPSKQRLIRGKNLLLIDDVYTTGATLNACAKVLKASGVQEVRALTLVRTVRVF